MHLNTTQCCNHTFTGSDIKGRLLNQINLFGTDDKHLYGGNVKRFAETSCPECGKEYYLWLKQKGQTWRVLTISDKNPPVQEEQTQPKRRGRQPNQS
ncbi:hypothetical protein DQG23_04460 [Paenibacillus contaminans]|uniref:Uncharacterized protein n=1 Tax=Paenibacillus contaminans TaxID=450362 RepID=A0A329MRN9_9BACL|nr:hypothetical protein DQG23_04460 [Paenibacillus contaminans]